MKEEMVANSSNVYKHWHTLQFGQGDGVIVMFKPNPGCKLKVHQLRKYEVVAN